MPADVQLASESSLVPDVQQVERWVDATLRESVGEVCVRFVDEKEGRCLNEQYRGRNKATNVLSFVAEDLPAGETLLGDLVICAPVVEREAGEQCKPTSHHYAHMVVHGVLHLLGHDHESDGEAQVMEALEKDVLDGLGIDDPYQARG